MLSISNYYRRKVNQNSKSNHTSQNGHSKKSIDSKCSRQLERDVTPASPTWQSVRRTLATATERRVSACGGGGDSKELILGSDIPTSAHISQKDTCTPTVISALLTGAKKQIQANVHWQIKEKVVHVYNGLLLILEKPPLKLWNYAKVTTRMNLGGSYTKWSYWDRGRQKNMISLQAKFLKHMKENHLKLKKTFPGDSNTN